MSSEEFKQAAFNPATRRLVRVTLGGMHDAIRLITSTWARKVLMMEKGFIKETPKLTANEIWSE